MIARVFPWTGDIRGEGVAHPDGRFAISIPGQGVVITSGEVLPEPHGPARYPDIPDHGPQIGCSGQNDPPVVYEWDGQAWQARGTAWGPNAVCYRGAQFYAIQSKAEFSQTGGYRAFVKGQLQTVESTHERHDLFDCTDWGDVCLGQLDDDRYGGGIGVRFADDGVLRRIVFENAPSDGPLRAMVVKRAGSSFALCVVDEHRHQTLIAWPLETELRAMAPAVPVAQPPPPQPSREPESTPVSLPNHLDTLQQVRAKYPALVTADEAVAILNEVAWIHRAEGWGLLRKDGGNHGAQPRTGILCSVDWLVNRSAALGFDAGGNGPDSTTGETGPDTPQWGAGEAFDLSRFVEPVEPIDGPAPTPEPIPQPPAHDDGPALARLQAEIDDIKAQMQALAAKPDPDLSAFVTKGATVQVTGSISLSDALYGRKVTWTGLVK